MHENVIKLLIISEVPTFFTCRAKIETWWWNMDIYCIVLYSKYAKWSCTEALRGTNSQGPKKKKKKKVVKFDLNCLRFCVYDLRFGSKKSFAWTIFFWIRLFHLLVWTSVLGPQVYVIGRLLHTVTLPTVLRWEKNNQLQLGIFKEHFILQ